MPTSFENFVNTELPKRIATNESPTTPQAGDIPVFSGVGLLTESKTASDAGLATKTFATTAANTAETNAKSYADGLVTSIYKFQTTYDPQTTGNFPTTANTVGGVAIKKGFTWVVSGVTGQYTFQGVTVDNGDTLLALVDNASATSAADWHITEKNLGYTPENQANKVDDLTESTSTAKYTSVKAVVDGLSGKQNTLSDVITANTYGSSTQWPVVTVNAKGIVTGVTLQTPTFTDATFSVQKNGSPAITASWDLTALTASYVHTYPDKAIDFKTLSSIGASDGNNLGGTRCRILGGSGNTIDGTGNIAIGSSAINTSGKTITSCTFINSNYSIPASYTMTKTTMIGMRSVYMAAKPLAGSLFLGSSDNTDLFKSPVAAATVLNSLFGVTDAFPVSGTLYATTDGVQTLDSSNCLPIPAQGGTTQYEIDFIVAVGSYGFSSVAAIGCIVMRRIFSVFYSSTGTVSLSAVDTVGTDRTLGTISGTFTPDIALSGTTHVTVGITRAGGVAGQEGMAISARVRSHITK